ncbi:esterase/lipase family protein [Kitasatospora sp. HPMI-4]|uniref:esterase/lipase family protein n=1 Tax=Kitasatospora sp. HPMI-4 TaxID=3448443 RepID=UPI003F1D9393
MSIPFQRTAATVRGAGAEAAAPVGRPLRCPTGVPSERQPRPCPARYSAAPAHHGPVLLLHGLNDNRAVFAPLRRTLRRHGWTHLHALNHSPLTGDVRAAAVLLARHVEWARQAHDGAPVALVGHGLGGLIARYYVQLLGGDELVDTLVTLATPHEGTMAALLPAPFPITRQLRPNSPLMAELRLPAPGCRTRFTAVRGELDELVLPGPHGWLHHPDLTSDNRLVAGAGHIGLPSHPRAVESVRRALETAERRRAGAQEPQTGRHAS